jgi:hypothetical protein
MKLLYLLALFPALLLAQQKQPVSSLQEDCGVTFSFNTASSGAQAAGTFTAGSTGTTSIIDNRQVGCLDWIVTYAPNTAVASVSLAFQIATDVLGVPTTWSNYAGTLNSGINPNTAITAGGAVTDATGPKYPFLRMNMTVLTGAGATISGRLYGWKRRPTSVSIVAGGGCPGTVGTPCVVDGPTASGSPPTTPPVLIAGSNGTILKTLLTNAQGGLVPAGIAGVDLGDNINFNTNFTPQLMNNSGTLSSMALPIIPYLVGDLGGFNRALSCTNRANVTLTTIGLTRIITNPGSLTIHICSLSLSFASPVDIQVVEGTQVMTACDTGPTNMTGLFRSVTGFDPAWGSNAALTQATFNDDVCISMSANVNGGGVVIYSAF